MSSTRESDIPKPRESKPSTVRPSASASSQAVHSGIENQAVSGINTGLLVRWDSQEHADAAAAVIRPRLEEHLAGHVQSPPEARLFEVIAD